MTTLVSLVLSNADKLPLVGSPINQATTWYRDRSHSQSSDLAVVETPPPPYEKEHLPSRLTQISDYVWKRASFSSHGTASSLQEHPQRQQTIVTKEEPLDKGKIQEGISLIQMATEMTTAPDKKNQQFAMDLYMMGLDKILCSLPINTDPVLKSTLETKLIEFKKRMGLVLHDPEEENMKRRLTEQEQKEALGGISSLVIQAAVLGAVALKRSPIPGILSRLFEATKTGLQRLDETCSIRERTLNITNVGIAKAIEIDQHYEVHQLFAEIFYTGCTALLKAGIAFAEDADSHKATLESSVVVPVA